MKSPLEACRDHTKPEFNKNIDAALFKIRNEDYPWLAQPSAKERLPAPGQSLNSPEGTYEVQPAPGHLLNYPKRPTFGRIQAEKRYLRHK